MKPLSDQSSRLQPDTSDPYVAFASILASLAELPVRLDHLESALADLQPQGKMLVTIQEAAELLGLGQTKVYELVRKRELPAIKIDSSTRIPVREIDRWIQDKLDEQ
jgi:excisionase family DNA binding protein